MTRIPERHLRLAAKVAPRMPEVYQLLALSALVDVCEAIATAGILGPTSELELRLLIAHVKKAYKGEFSDEHAE